MVGSVTRRRSRLHNRFVVMWHPFNQQLWVRRSISDAAIAVVAFALLALVGLPPWLVSDTRRRSRLRSRIVVTQHSFNHLSVRHSNSDAAIAVVAFALLALVGLPPWLVVILGGVAGYAIGLL